jgi:hypothetical protein
MPVDLVKPRRPPAPASRDLSTMLIIVAAAMIVLVTLAYPQTFRPDPAPMSSAHLEGP